MTLFCGLAVFTDAAEIYYTNRTFTVVGFGNQIRPADMLNAESKKLTNIVKGAAVQLDTTNTYAIERNAVALGHTTAAGAWNAAVNYNYDSLRGHLAQVRNSYLILCRIAGR